MTTLDPRKLAYRSVNTTTVSVIHRGHERARTVPWRGGGATALITPAPNGPLLSGDFVRHCLETLAGQGFGRVITSALSPLEQAGFLAAGFEVEKQLRLLMRPLGTLPPLPEGARLTNVRASRIPDVLAVDGAAFPDFWRFDELALEDALHATPRTHFRASRGRHGSVTGYAVTGRALRRGYIQRLAIDPAAQGQGLGRRLLLDGLHWLVKEGATSAYVNTQTDNSAAYNLYTSVGFREEPLGLSGLSAGR